MLEQFVTSGLKIVTGISVNGIVSNIVRVTAPKNISTVGKVINVVGSVVLANVIMQPVNKYIEQNVEQAFTDAERMAEKRKLENNKFFNIGKNKEEDMKKK